MDTALDVQLVQVHELTICKHGRLQETAGQQLQVTMKPMSQTLMSTLVLRKAYVECTSRMLV